MAYTLINKTCTEYIMASLIGSGTVSNPMTSDLLANGFNISGSATVTSVRAETQTLAVPAGSGLLEVVCEDSLLIQGNNSLLFGAPSVGTTSISIQGDPGRDVVLGPIPAGAQTNILGYNTATNKLTYFATPSGGGTVTAIAAGANITVNNTNPAVPAVSLSAPLTSVLDVGTQDITTSVANADIDITTNGTGGVHIVQAGVSANGAVRIIQTGAGAITNPALRLVNQNATGSVALEIYKNKPTAGVAGEQLALQSVYGKDSTNAKQEYTRISHTIREATAGSEDGSIELGCLTNGTFQNYIQINGNDPANGEVNILRPLDLASGSTGLIKTSVGGGSINITADTTGTVALNSASGEVFLNGNSVRMNTGGIKFFECPPGGSNPSFSRPLEITEAGGTAVFTVNVSPQPNLSISGMPIAPSGFLEGSALTGSAGQLITANGSGGWSWQTPATATDLASVLLSGNSAGSSSLNMNSQDVSNALRYGVTGGFGTNGQTLISQGSSGSYYSFTLPCVLTGTNSTPVSLTSSAWREILGNPTKIYDTLTSPSGKYLITFTIYIDDINDDLFFYPEVNTGLGGNIGGQTFIQANPFCVKTLSLGGVYSGSFTFSDVFIISGDEPEIYYLYCKTGSGSHNTNVVKFNISAMPITS